jgi:hypothetical protein
MRNLLLILIFLLPLMVVGTIEYAESYNRCIHEGSKLVFTDMDAELLERKCR